MDNRLISVQSEGREAFDLAIQIVFTLPISAGKATHYFEHPDKGLIFLWHEDSFFSSKNLQEKAPAIKLLVPMGWKQAADLGWAWLQAREPHEYQDHCDHDGSDGHGFRVYTEHWNSVAESKRAICGILPVWAWYGK